MADKQAILAKAAPGIINRLVNPLCVGPGGDLKPVPDASSACPSGYSREVAPVTDMHVGVVTSSLGGHGAPTNFCNPQGADAKPGATNNDHAHLLPKVRSTLTSWNNSGFLAWDPKGKDNPPGEKDLATFESDVANEITSAGEQGCGFESTLEAMYRFLADPKPPAGVQVVNNVSSPTGVDTEVISERKAFLRPDSAVMVVLLTDEDDCSIEDQDLGWLVARQDHMPRATTACATNPGSPCCRSCALSESSPPPGCTALQADPSCNQGSYTDTEDPLNLRCLEQKRRFGLDLLYPVKRYENALTKTKICPDNPDLACSAGDTPVQNPLFAGGRSVSLVSATVITGVPWQDIARNPSSTQNLSFLSASELASKSRFDVIAGDPASYKAPTDPLMKESVDPRTGKNPITGDPIAPPSAGVLANPMNGHEYDIPSRDDLQYACIFPLATPKQSGYDCGMWGQPMASGDKPLCQNPQDGTYSTTQYFAKAYPGLRQLSLMHALGDRGVTTSICPAVADPSSPDYGYNPAVRAMVERLNRMLE